MNFGRLSILLLLIVTLYNTGVSQKIYIFSQQTGNPIIDVVLINSDNSKSAISNSIGIADISIFSEKEEITFQHPSYQSVILTKEIISELKFKVSLTEKLIKLNEVIVSASKWETKANEIPNQIEKISRKEIILENPATSADMLSKGNQVFVQKSQLGGGSPMIRGFAANKILFVVDGIRMNNAIYRSGNLHNVLQADINSIEDAEVIFGPGTNIYGSDALGGVIDFHTLALSYNSNNKMSTTGSALARIGSANFERTLNANVNIANDRWAFMTSISFSKFADQKMGSNHNSYNLRPEYIDVIDGVDSIIQNSNPEIQKYSGYDQLSIISKVGHKFSENIDWEYGLYLTTTSAVPRYDRLTQYSDDKLKYAVWNYDPQQWFMNRLTINMYGNASWYDNSTISFGFQNVKEGRNDRKYKDNWLRKRSEQVNIFSFNSDFDKSLGNGNTLYYGVEFIFNDVTSEGEKENISTGDKISIASRYPDGGTKYSQVGAYLSYKKNFSRIPLTFLTGFRYSFVYLNSKFIDTSYYQLPYSTIKLSNNAITGSIGLVYHPGEWQYNINLSSGFRAPNLDDVAKIFDSEPGNVVVPNENLKPEYIYNADIGIIRKFDGIAKIEVNGFYSYLVDAMVRRDFTLNGMDSIYYDGELSKVQAIVNAASANIYGISFQASAKITNYLSIRTMATWMNGEDDSGESIRHVPPFYGSSGLTFENGKLKLVLSADYNGEISYNDLALSERDKAYIYATDSNGNPYSPGWWTLNFNGTYLFNNSFLTSFGVDNILDYRYRPYSSGIAAPGRNFKLAFRYTF